MATPNLDIYGREYTLSQINWKRSLTDVDLKRKKKAEREKAKLEFRILEKIVSPTLGFEVQYFRLFNELNQTETHIHNTLPTHETLVAERECIHFEDRRRRQPHAVRYKDFYGCIEPEARKPRTPKTPASIALSGIDIAPSPLEETVSRAQSQLQSRNSRRSNTVNGFLTPRDLAVPRAHSQQRCLSRDSQRSTAGKGFLFPNQ